MPASTYFGRFHTPDGGVEELWSLRDDVLVDGSSEEGSITLSGPWGDFAIRRPGAILTEALRRMRLGPVSLENVLDHRPLPGRSLVAERAQLFVALERLQHMVVRSLAAKDGEQPLMSVVPVSDRARFDPEPVDPDRPVRLSTYATVRTDGGVLRVESPLSLQRVLVHQPEAALIAVLLARPATPAELAEAVPLPFDLVLAVVSYLVAAGISCRADAGGGAAFAEDRDPTLRMWSHADLSFHTRSTLGRNDAPFGATYPFGDGPCPEPALKRYPDEGRIKLHRPGLADVLSEDPPLTAVLEARRSTRRFDPTLTAPELGELLYRALRVRGLYVPPGGEPAQATGLDRPYPGGGAIHELEFYITLAGCSGIGRGVYAYDAYRHELVPVTGDPASVESLLGGARRGADLDDEPPALITVTARFGRIFWKYSGLGYALVLKHVGVVMQTLYLVGTAMGMGCCAIGDSEVEQTSRILGLDWLAESSVGAFVVGRPARSGPGPGDGLTRLAADADDWQKAAPTGQSDYAAKSR